MAPHSSNLAWKIPWTEEPRRLQSMGLLRVGHDWATSFIFHFYALEKEMATRSCSCLENPRDWGAWWAAFYGVAQSRTWLKWLSSKPIVKTLSQSKSSMDSCFQGYMLSSTLQGCFTIVKRILYRLLVFALIKDS